MKLSKKNCELLRRWWWNLLIATIIFTAAAMAFQARVVWIVAGILMTGLAVISILLIANGCRHGTRGRSRLGTPRRTAAVGDVRRPGKPEGVKRQ